MRQCVCVYEYLISLCNATVGGVPNAFFHGAAVPCRPGRGLDAHALGIWESGHGGHLTACHALAAVVEVAAVSRWTNNEQSMNSQWVSSWVSETGANGSYQRLFRICQALSISSLCISSPGALQLLRIESTAGYCWNKQNKSQLCDNDSGCELANGTHSLMALSRKVLIARRNHIAPFGRKLCESLQPYTSWWVKCTSRAWDQIRSYHLFTLWARASYPFLNCLDDSIKKSDSRSHQWDGKFKLIRNIGHIWTYNIGTHIGHIGHRIWTQVWTGLKGLSKLVLALTHLQRRVGRTLRDVSSMLPPVLSILNMFKPSAKAGQCTCVFPTACSIRTV